MKKVLALLITIITLVFGTYYAVIYFSSFSQGNRSGELIKFSNKGVLFKTWEGEISQGISGAQIFHFSVEDKDDDVIQKLNELHGKYVKLTYKERFSTFSWLGDTPYFVTAVTEEESPHFRNK